MNPQELFCPNEACPSRGFVGAGNILVHSRKPPRCKCKTCGKAFAASKGTAFYRLHKKALFVIVNTLLAFGCPVPAIVAAFGLDERTVYEWMERAGLHCQQVHAHLVSEQSQDLGQVQADEIRVKLQKRTVAWMALAVCVPTRLWLGGALSASRDKALIQTLAAHVKACALYSPLLLVSDGLTAYVKGWKGAFRTPVWTGRPGRPALLEWPHVLIGQVVKQKENGRVVGVLQRMVQGTLEQSRSLGLLVTEQLNTAYIERLNATFRARLSALVRRTRGLARQIETLSAGMYLVGTVYNFCTYHKSLRLEQPPSEARESSTRSVGTQGRRKWRQRTPAMAAGITDHFWSVEELMTYRIPPPPYVPPRRRGRPPKTAATPALAGCPT